MTLTFYFWVSYAIFFSFLPMRHSVCILYLNGRLQRRREAEEKRSSERKLERRSWPLHCIAWQWIFLYNFEDWWNRSGGFCRLLPCYIIYVIMYMAWNRNSFPSDHCLCNSTWHDLSLVWYGPRNGFQWGISVSDGFPCGHLPFTVT